MKKRFLYILMLFVNMVWGATHMNTSKDLEQTVKNFQQITPNVASGGVLGEGAVEQLKADNFTTIIDLRTKAEGVDKEKTTVENAGLHYVNIPITAAGIDDLQLSQFSNALEHAKGPVLVHCASGNRVGAMLVRYYISQGVESKIAFERGRKAGLQLPLEQTIKLYYKERGMELM